jgi:hypothetical protein
LEISRFYRLVAQPLQLYPIPVRTNDSPPACYKRYSRTVLLRPLGEIQLFPGFNPSGVIPPYLVDPRDPNGSPYRTDLCTLVRQLGTTPHRQQLLSQFLDYREALRQVGITSGFQLVDGSFTENCEVIRGLPPSDIDLVTYAHVPVSPHLVTSFMHAHIALFDPAQTKAVYHCDAYFVDLAKSSELVVDDTFYWYGLFSHQKVSANWKGMLRIPLMWDDVAARAALAALAGGASGP